MLRSAYPAILMTSAFAADQWRWTILSTGIGAILLTIGFTSIGIFLFRRQSRDRTLRNFGIFVILYAIREFLREPPLLSVFAISPAIADHIIRAITFTFALPISFLFLEVMESRWRRIILWGLWVQLVFAPFAILFDLLGIARRRVDVTYSLLVAGSSILLIACLFVLRPAGRIPREFRVVAVGLAVFILFALHANLVGLQIIPGRDVEPIGFLAFVLSLGFLVVHRVLTREESLLAIQKELEIAEQIQTSILPRSVPLLAGLDIAARYLPMSAVAGDFYDFFKLEGRQLGVLIADVSGHGVPAALIASMLKVAFAVQTTQAQSPERVLFGLNQALCGQFESHFVTAAYVYADLDAKIIRYAGAGHPPLLLINRSNRDVRCIERNGLILGMFPEAVYSSIEIPLQPGDRCVLYTDGLLESTNTSSEEFGMARCKEFLATHAALSAAAFADELIEEIVRWSARPEGRRQEDDLTLIVVDRQASPSVG